MKSPRKGKPAKRIALTTETGDGILIRPCHGIPEFEACVRVEREVWQSSDIDVVPIPLFVVASKTGGQVLGAFRGMELIGFTLAIAGWRARKPLLHSHMTAVLEGYRNCGVGRRLKHYQREDALASGIALVEWTFDPLVTRNAYFNFMRLGAIARRYLPNVYGITTSPLHRSLPTDRLVAEWHLRSSRVRGLLAGKRTSTRPSKKAVRIPIPATSPESGGGDAAHSVQIQSQVRAEFQKWLGKGYVATAVEQTSAGMDYILEPGSSV
jgi:predicted GNAT superfamily acetyltransferase